MPQEIRLNTLKKALEPFTTAKQRKLIIAITSVLLALVASIATFLPHKSPDYVTQYNDLQSKGELLKADFDVTTQAQKATVTAITDGDTIKVTLDNGENAIIRYIGIDTPEIKHQGKGKEDKFGKEATELNTWLLRDKIVYLQHDVGDKDKYDRLLRYVYLPDGTMVNYAIIRLGYAQILTVQPNVAFQKKFLAAQQKAREERRILWGD